MASVEHLVATARKNEVIARNLFDIEVAIMNITRCPQFFLTLVSLVKEKFEIDHVWMVLTDTPSNSHLVDSLREAKKENEDAVLKTVSMVDFLRVTHSIHEPILVNQGISRYHALLPLELKALGVKIGSMAMLPVVVDGKVVGALILGSESAERYNPKKDSFFLKQLSVKVSTSLAGVWARERISFLATRDPLTMLRNRRELEESLDQELSRHARQREHLAVMFIDCDDFKIVNDTYGHDCGDKVLTYVATQLQELIRENDKCFRYAGDEFVITLASQTYQEALLACKRLTEFFQNNPMPYEGSHLPITISCGAAASDGKKTMEELLKQADEQLYFHKKSETIIR